MPALFSSCHNIEQLSIKCRLVLAVTLSSQPPNAQFLSPPSPLLLTSHTLGCDNRPEEDSVKLKTACHPSGSC